MIKKSIVALFGILVFGTFLYYKPVVKDDFDIISELKKRENNVRKEVEYLSNNERLDD